LDSDFSRPTPAGVASKQDEDDYQFQNDISRHQSF
jgi:hypothetical protein